MFRIHCIIQHDTHSWANPLSCPALTLANGAVLGLHQLVVHAPKKFLFVQPDFIIAQLFELQLGSEWFSPI